MTMTFPQSPDPSTWPTLAERHRVTVGHPGRHPELMRLLEREGQRHADDRTFRRDSGGEYDIFHDL
jgi:hypothetical protein